MKIYVLGSNSFVKKMVASKNELSAFGHDGWIHPDYEAHVQGKKQAFPELPEHGEHAEFKRAHNYLNQHYQNILKSDAVLIVNEEKNGIQNYIGGNCLMEMGQAYVNGKKIFLLNDIPAELPYLDEIKAMDPVCLHGNVTNIK